MKDRNRIYYFDYLKVLAIFLVVFNHTGTKGFFLFAEEMNSPMFYPYMIVSILDKVAVPLLFMLSGALLLQKKESIKQLWKKRIFKYIVIIIIFSFVRYLYVLATISEPKFSLLLFFRSIYVTPIEIPYWYLYAYLAGLIMLPFLRAIARNISDSEFKYLIYLQVVLFGILPILQYIFRMGNINLDIPIAADSVVFYMLLGYYLHNRKSELSENKSFMIILWGLVALTLIVTVWMVMYQYQISGILTENASQTFFTSFTPIFATAIFLSFQKIEKKVNPNKKHLVLNYFSGAVLGTYLLEEMGRMLLVPVFDFLNPLVGPFLAGWIFVIVVVIVTATITNILKKLPLIKKIL